MLRKPTTKRACEKLTELQRSHNRTVKTCNDISIRFYDIIDHMISRYDILFIYYVINTSYSSFGGKSI